MASPALLRRVLALPPALRRSLYSTASRPEIYDVVCIGGGPAGLSLVSALRTNPTTRDLKIALLDAQDLSSPRSPLDVSSYSNRCSSLTPSSVRFLQQIGAWNNVKAQRTQDYHTMDVWDGVSGSKIHFDGLDAQSGPGLLESIAELVPGNRFQESRKKYETDDSAGVIATMCENNNLTAALLENVGISSSIESGPITVLDRTKVESITLGPEAETEKDPNLTQWPIVNTTTSSLAARLLIGADGANSPVRQFADIPGHGWDYNQQGVVATLTLDQDYPADCIRTAYQRFLPTGPIALLPLPGNRATLVWSTSPAHAARLKSLSPEDFIASVNAAFRLQTIDVDFMLSSSSNASPSSEYSWRLPNTDPTTTGLPAHLPTVLSAQPGSIASFPLRMRHASTYTGHRVALLGDAAHTIHPLAGQGLNLGLADAQALASQIVYGVEHGMDIGSNWCLDGYNEERWAQNNAVMGVCDKLQKLYSVSSGPVVWGRSLGLSAVDRLGAVKGWVMGAAAGR
nr:ubiquinone biosynthesis monooxygenase coq6, mitochondrial [Quercus suber]